jgi:DNA-binding NtrC family response regulator
VPVNRFRGDGETVLIVDDEPAVLSVMRRGLERPNFKAVTAEDGSEALAKVANIQSDLRLVITDMHMPHMDGLHFQEVEAAFAELGVSMFFSKPFTRVRLAELVEATFRQ